MLLFAPGATSYRINRDLDYSRQLRDEDLWEYPILPGAILTYQSMAANREWKLTGPERVVTTAYDWLTEAVTLCDSGVVEYGFNQFLSRRALDYLAVGRTLFLSQEGQPLRYLDPTQVQYQKETKKWINYTTREEYNRDDVIVDHALPLGNTGAFVAPIKPCIPLAILAWLIDEHDRASADGRKIRDIFIVSNDELAKQIADSVQDSLKMWTQPTPEALKVNVVYANKDSVKDVVTRLGLANIPETLNRHDFDFRYVNTIAAALGISVRHFWQDERGTNRALEEVQEQRQQTKGPSAFVRREQRSINQPNAIKRFSKNVKFAFIEEVDSQSQESKGKVLESFANGLEKFANVFGGTINGENFLAWLQSENILPADLELITDMGSIQQSDGVDSQPESSAQSESGVKPTKTTKPTKKQEEKAQGIPDYDEISIDSNGRLIDKRRKIFSVEKLVATRLSRESGS